MSAAGESAAAPGAARFERVLTAPWGEGPGRLPRAEAPYPPFGEVAEGQMRTLPAPLAVRLDPAGGVHVLASGPGGAALHHFGADGRPAGVTPLDVEGAAQGADFAVDAGGAAYLLERSGRLRKVRPDGSAEWTGEDAGSGGEDGRLRLDGAGRPFLAAGGAVFAVGPADGALHELDRPGVPPDKVFVEPGGALVYVAWFPDRERRGISRFDPAAGGGEDTVGSAALHGWLVWPLGVDARSRLYAWRDDAFARIAPDGDVRELARLNGAAVAPDGTVYVSRAAGDAVEVDAHGPGGARAGTRLALPAGAEGDGWHLVRVDGEGRFHLHGGEAPGSAGTLLVFGADGAPLNSAGATPDALAGESRLQPFAHAQVDAAGRIYLPLADGAAFHVVRLSAP